MNCSITRTLFPVAALLAGAAHGGNAYGQVHYTLTELQDIDVRIRRVHPDRRC
jgi:hypothetical protein